MAPPRGVALAVAAVVALALGAAVAPLAGAAVPCPNEALRLGASASLPDCRAYEQATPTDKNGGDAFGTAGAMQAANDGNGIVFVTQVVLPGAEGGQEFPFNLASRSAAGWSSQTLLPPAATGPRGVVRGWSEDLSAAYDSNADVKAGSAAFYLRESADASLRTIAAGPQSLEQAFFAGAASDGSTVVFESRTKLVPEALEGSSNVYAWDKASGALRLASVLNGGESPAEGAFAGPYNWLFGQNTANGGAAAGNYTQAQHAVSADGSRVFFAAAGSGQLYVRLNPTASQSALDGEGNCTEPQAACTVRISASRKTNGIGPGGTDPAGPQPAAFMGATPDGSAAVFTSSEELTNDANTGPAPTIGRANLDGSGVEPSFISGLAQGVAVDASHVYWANPSGGSIGRANLDGTAVEPSFISGVGTPQGVAADASHVYWTNAGTGANGAGSIGRANLDGSGVEPSFIAGASNPQGIAVNATHIYWANVGTTFATRRLGRANLDGSGATQTFTGLNTTVAGPFAGIAVDAAHLYWAAAGRVARANLDGTEPNQAFISTAGSLRGVAVDAANVYWADAASSSVGRANLDGTGVNPSFIAGATQPFGLAVDATQVYWASNAADVGNDLYRYQVDSGQLTDLAPHPGEANGADVRGILGTSDDGSRVYFVANGVLAPGAAPGDCSGAADVTGFLTSITGACNLYVWHDGAFSFISRLEPGGASVERSDATNWLPSPRTNPAATDRTSRVTADGETVLFRSHLQLTPYDNEGEPELYRYRIGDSSPSCISCNPSGAPPTGPASLFTGTLVAKPVLPAAVLTRNLSIDGDRVFFETSDALVPADLNGVQDVYEWEADDAGSCEGGSANGGCLYLLSTGTATTPSFFADASPSGEDAFLFTRQPLVAQDGDELQDIYDARVGGGLAFQDAPEPAPCTGEGCKGPPAPAPASQSPGTTGFVGPGNAATRCAGFARRARALRGRARQLRVRAGRAGQRRQARRLRDRAARLKKSARRQSKSVKRCRRARQRARGASR